MQQDLPRFTSRLSRMSRARYDVGSSIPRRPFSSRTKRSNSPSRARMGTEGWDPGCQSVASYGSTGPALERLSRRVRPGTLSKRMEQGGAGTWVGAEMLDEGLEEGEGKETRDTMVWRRSGDWCWVVLPAGVKALLPAINTSNQEIVVCRRTLKSTFQPQHSLPWASERCHWKVRSQRSGHVAGSQNCMEVQLSAHCQHAMGHDAPEIIPTPFQYLALSDGCRCL